MEPKEDTKNGPEQKQPDALQQEPPRKCKICGGPNHHGCGCEAKQLRKAEEAGLTENEAKALLEPEPQPASEARRRRTVGMVENEISKLSEQQKSDDDILKNVFSPEAIKESDKVNKQMAKDIRTMADGFEGLCTCMYDTNNYLKIIAGDLITIRKILTKEDEAKNADPDKNKN